MTEPEPLRSPLPANRLEIEEARRKILHYLGGKPLGREALREALTTLNRYDPAELGRLYQAAMGGLPVEPEESVADWSERERLSSAAAGHGLAAPEEAVYFQAPKSSLTLEDLAVERAEWLALSDRIACAVRPAQKRLVLVRDTWHWANESLRLLDTLSDQAVQAGKRVLDWVLEAPVVNRSQLPAPAYRFGEGREPLLVLSVDLAEAPAKVRLAVLPISLSSVVEELWLFRFELDNGGPVKLLQVGMRTESGKTAGMRALRKDRPADFRLPPPAQEPYWAMFEWAEAEVRRTKQIEIPVRGQSDDAGPALRE
ncbi:MAG: hypothetical protein HUU20_16480 [Pirellulales bacterium]|nr:hypothetical protein [Pirellulales bacterium]